MTKSLKNYNKKNNTYNIVAFTGGMAAGKDTYAQALKDLKPLAIEIAFADSLRHEISDIIAFSRTLPSDTNQLTQRLLQKASELQVPIEDLVNITQRIVNLDTQLIDENLTAYTRHEDMRRILQIWGTDVRRRDNNNYWIDKTMTRIKELHKTSVIDTFIITDARFLNEIESVVNQGGLIVQLNVPLSIRKERIKKRDGFYPSDKSLSHPSETEYLQYQGPKLILKSSHENLNYQTLKNSVNIVNSHLN